jgi:hypothetical protein
MKKSKIVLPFLAVLFAIIASAFTPTDPFAQSGWYDENDSAADGGMPGTITTPVGNTPECSTTATSHVCKIQVGLTEYNAFISEDKAEQNGGQPNDGLLRYN